jgi:hypothetical protein
MMMMDTERGERKEITELCRDFSTSLDMASTKTVADAAVVTDVMPDVAKYVSPFHEIKKFLGHLTSGGIDRSHLLKLATDCKSELARVQQSYSVDAVNSHLKSLIESGIISTLGTLIGMAIVSAKDFEIASLLLDSIVNLSCVKTESKDLLVKSGMMDLVVALLELEPSQLVPTGTAGTAGTDDLLEMTILLINNVMTDNGVHTLWTQDGKLIALLQRHLTPYRYGHASKLLLMAVIPFLELCINSVRFCVSDFRSVAKPLFDPNAHGLAREVFKLLPDHTFMASLCKSTYDCQRSYKIRNYLYCLFDELILWRYDLEPMLAWVNRDILCLSDPEFKAPPEYEIDPWYYYCDHIRDSFNLLCKMIKSPQQQQLQTMMEGKQFAIVLKTMITLRSEVVEHSLEAMNQGYHLIYFLAGREWSVKEWLIRNDLLKSIISCHSSDLTGPEYHCAILDQKQSCLLSLFSDPCLGIDLKDAIPTPDGAGKLSAAARMLLDLGYFEALLASRKRHASWDINTCIHNLLQGPIPDDIKALMKARVQAHSVSRLAPFDEVDVSSESGATMALTIPK